MKHKQYTDREDALAKGLIKKNGCFYKQTLLEIWHNKGWLELKNSRYGADDRLRFGLKFMLDYHLANRFKLHSGFIFNDKIDSSVKNESMESLDAQNRYRRAVRSVPPEFWPVVRRVCLEEKEPIVPPQLSERQKTYFYFLCRIDLCRGLDRIIETYTKS